MKAVVVIDGEEIKVEGKDLTIESNMLTSEIYIVDRADDRRVFSGHRSLINYARIIDDTNDVIIGYLSAIRADGGDTE